MTFTASQQVAIPAPARRLPSSRTVITTLLGATLVLKALGFGFDYLSYYVGAQHGTTAAGAALTVFGIGWCIEQALCGAMTDRLGQRTTLTVWLAASAVACVSLAVLTSLPAVIAVALAPACTRGATHQPRCSSRRPVVRAPEVGRSSAWSAEGPPAYVRPVPTLFPTPPTARASCSGPGPPHGSCQRIVCRILPSGGARPARAARARPGPATWVGALPTPHCMEPMT
ncbi:hypothetical protein GCM10022207_88780 [Streptomyces lannensis]|uniref:Major facilitator superfamily (MFS) profile domain-containing protein n=1 Tax=Streptomyces lannensis TaxID=766498 RepID=A0ABP7LR48_9ACTN